MPSQLQICNFGFDSADKTDEGVQGVLWGLWFVMQGIADLRTPTRFTATASIPTKCKSGTPVPSKECALRSTVSVGPRNPQRLSPGMRAIGA